MNFTNNSKKLISYLIKNKCVENIKLNKNTQKILLNIYDELLEAYEYISQLKKTKYYNLTIKQIINSNQISKPLNYSNNSFPYIIKQHIELNSLSELEYSFSLFNRNIKIFFITEILNIEMSLKKFNMYIDNIIMWLYILNKHSTKKCSKNLKIFIYFTPFEKKLPKSNIEILNVEHVNTAFTTSCTYDSEIVIFRKEEWFKVFLHETFHNFGLDFSDMDNQNCNKFLLNIFKVKSDVNAFEAYAEFWANLMNNIFCSFYVLKNKKNSKQFLKNVEPLINLEISYSVLQLIKVLEFMGISYNDLYLNKYESKIARNNLYKEHTNVLAYYIIKLILLFNFDKFLEWCNTNNITLFHFTKTISNQIKFCKFIENYYKSKKFLDKIKSIQSCYKYLKDNKNKMSKSDEYILNTLRMVVCELT